MICAPIWTRGCTTRSIGRDLRDESPDSTLRKGWPESRPASSRIAVPLFPASRTSSGSCRPFRPRPWTSKHSTFPSVEQREHGTMETPRPRRHRRIDSRSSPAHRLETWAVPSAMAFRSSALWDIDLSPGREIVPRRRFGGPITCCMSVFGLGVAGGSWPSAAGISRPAAHRPSSTCGSVRPTFGLRPVLPCALPWSAPRVQTAPGSVRRTPISHAAPRLG